MVALDPFFAPYWNAHGNYSIVRLSNTGFSAWTYINGELKCVPLICLEK